MKIQQRIWRKDTGWEVLREQPFNDSPILVFVFGNRFLLEEQHHFDKIQSFYPTAEIILNSTSGEIINGTVYDDSITLTAMQFDKTKFDVQQVKVSDFENGFDTGKAIAKTMDTEELKHVIVISDGGLVNGSELVKGLNHSLPEGITTTGGLAGDGPRFEKTLVGWNNAPKPGNVIAIGLYGAHIKVGYGSVGGWEAFGPKREITKSTSNVLYELDGKSALELYKNYLGDKAEGLPGSALLFPLCIQLSPDAQPLVRTILSIDEENQCMVFAGDLPEGATVRLMKANFDKLIDGAFEAAESGKKLLPLDKPEVAILISCVGRKLVLDQRIEEEVESVLEVIGEDIPITGFYSYGEISPFSGFQNCELHNQTMTITLLGEN